MSMDIKQRVRENREFMIQTRRYFHRHPELSGKEFNTAEYIVKHLEEWDIPYARNDVGNVVAVIKGAMEGKVAALRGDIDALPILENTGLPFASENVGVMHACGHDCHATYMLTAAKILKDLRQEIKGTVKIIFQESEENVVGARKLMQSGLLDDVDNIAAVHISQEADLGTCLIGYGVQSACNGNAELLIEAEKGNAIQVAAQIVAAITARARLLFPPEDFTVIVPTVMKTEADNKAVPDKVRLFYNFRTHNKDNFEHFRKLVYEVPAEIGRAFDAKVTTQTVIYDVAVNNDKASTDRAIRVITETLGADKIFRCEPWTAAEDFGVYQEKIPGVFFHVGGAVNGEYRPLHTDKTYVDDGVLEIGEELLLAYAFDFLNGN